MEQSKRWEKVVPLFACTVSQEARFTCKATRDRGMQEDMFPEIASVVVHKRLLSICVRMTLLSHSRVSHGVLRDRAWLEI
jgi:hypothetical protein